LDRNQLDRGGHATRPPRRHAVSSHALVLTSLRTTPEALLQQLEARGSTESWHWIRDIQPQEDADRNRGKGAGAMATLRVTALNLVRLSGFESIQAGVQAVMHEITTLLAMVRRQPKPNQ
jgi:hypothetical protein